MYSSYTAASFAREQELADKHGVNLEGALTWAFEFEDQPYFAGFRSLASNGIDKPVLNVFRMFSKMRGRRLAVKSDAGLELEEITRNGAREKPDVSAMASREGRKMAILLWHYHDDDLPGPEADIEITLEGLPEEVSEMKMEHFRIDETHSNAFTAWRKMGSPQNPSGAEYALLEKAGQLAQLGTSTTLKVDKGNAKLGVALPRQAVSLLLLE